MLSEDQIGQAYATGLASQPDLYRFSEETLRAHARGFLRGLTFLQEDIETMKMLERAKEQEAIADSAVTSEIEGEEDDGC